MIGDKRVLCIIPVRGGSKGVANKSARPLAGRPLMAYTVDDALACPEIDRTIVSTDDENLARIAREAGIDVPFMRPAELAGDTVSTIDVLVHAMEQVAAEEGPYDLVVLLHATAPFRAPEDVTACLRLVAEEGAENAFSVSEAHRNPYFNLVELAADGTVHLSKQGTYTRRQDTPPVYDLNAAVYVWPWETLLQKRAVILPGSRIHVMPPDRSIDIDTDLDFRMAECLIASGGYAVSKPL